MRDTPKAVTSFGGLVVFIEFLQRIGYAAHVQAHRPFVLTSSNAIAPAHTLTAFVFAVVAGARRFAHAELLRADRALQALLGLKRFPGHDTIRGLFLRFGQADVEAFWRPLWRWLLGWVQPLSGGFALDLDSTIFQRAGRQQGAKKGYNPRRPGRKSHHPLLAVLAEAHFVLHAWLRFGYIGGITVANWPSKFDLNDEYINVDLNEKVRAPLWDLVFHDSVVSTWRWNFTPDRYSDSKWWDRHDLLHLIGGDIPICLVSRRHLETNGDRIVQSYKNVSEWNAKVGWDELVDHKDLTPDRTVQESRFSSGLGGHGELRRGVLPNAPLERIERQQQL